MRRWEHSGRTLASSSQGREFESRHFHMTLGEYLTSYLESFEEIQLTEEVKCTKPSLFVSVLWTLEEFKCTKPSLSVSVPIFVVLQDIQLTKRRPAVLGLLLYASLPCFQRKIRILFFSIKFVLLLPLTNR